MLYENKMTRNQIYAGISLFIVFFCLYFIASGFLEKASAFEEFDILFEMDTPRVIEDMTVFREDHSRTRVHPLFVMMVNPLGTLLTRLTQSGILTARILNSVFGAFGVALAFFFFLRYSRETIDALLLASLFGVSTSQLFLSSIPDTISLAVCSLILTYILFYFSLKSKKIYFLWWFLAGMFSLSVTTTNFAQTAICFFIASLNSSSEKKLLKSVWASVKYGVVVLTAAIGLSLIQKVIYPTTDLFFLPQAYEAEFVYASTLIFQRSRYVVVHLIKNFLMSNIAAPAPMIFEIHGLENPGVTFGASHDYSWIGWVVVILWLGLMLFSVLKILLEKKNLPFYLGLAACLLFNFLLHAFYGVTEKRIELFLYTGNLTFLLITPLAEVFLPGREKLTRVVLVLFILLMAINNILVMKTLIQALGG